MRLLIVEDAMPVRQRMADFFGAVAALDVRTAANGAAALATFRTWQPDIVTLDVALPGSTGIELLETIKAERPGTRVVMFSNHVFCRGQCLLAGADGFFDKAHDWEAMSAAVVGIADAVKAGRGCPAPGRR